MPFYPLPLSLSVSESCPTTRTGQQEGAAQAREPAVAVAADDEQVGNPAGSRKGTVEPGS